MEIMSLSKIQFARDLYTCVYFGNKLFAMIFYSFSTIFTCL